jgi:hypothetical protein
MKKQSIANRRAMTNVEREKKRGGELMGDVAERQFLGGRHINSQRMRRTQRITKRMIRPHLPHLNNPLGIQSSKGGGRGFVGRFRS